MGEHFRIAVVSSSFFKFYSKIGKMKVQLLAMTLVALLVISMLDVASGAQLQLHRLRRKGEDSQLHRLKRANKYLALPRHKRHYCDNWWRACFSGLFGGSRRCVNFC